MGAIKVKEDNRAIRIIGFVILIILIIIICSKETYYTKLNKNYINKCLNSSSQNPATSNVPQQVNVKDQNQGQCHVTYVRIKHSITIFKIYWFIFFRFLQTWKHKATFLTIQIKEMWMNINM